MANEYDIHFMKKKLIPLTPRTARKEILNSAKMDEDYYGKPIGYFTTCSIHSSVDHWHDLETIAAIIRIASETDVYKTTVTIERFEKTEDNGYESLGVNHTSFDDRADDFKKQVDNGDLALCDIELIVFKKKGIDLDKDEFETIYKYSEGIN